MGESITEGTLTKWLKQVGDTVQRDEPLFEISTDKVDAEIPSPIAGKLTEIKVQEGATVGINTVVAILAEEGSASQPATSAAPAAPVPPPANVDTKEVAKPSAPAASTSAERTDVPMPQMGESITEGTITKWLKKIGDVVQRDEPLFEISTDKVDAEIPSPVSGTLIEIKATEGQTVAVNSIVAVIGGSAAASAPAAVATPTPQASAAAASPKAEAPASSGAATEVLMPQMGESITEGTITKWLKQVGDPVKEDELLFEVSTDKVDSEVPSSAAGTLTEILVQEGETVDVGTKLAVISSEAPSGGGDSGNADESADESGDDSGDATNGPNRSSSRWPRERALRSVCC